MLYTVKMAVTLGFSSQSEMESEEKMEGDVSVLERADPAKQVHQV